MIYLHGTLQKYIIERKVGQQRKRSEKIQKVVMLEVKFQLHINGVIEEIADRGNVDVLFLS